MSRAKDRLIEKYEALGENPDTYLEGLFHTRPITYWDYVEVDTLLSLQRPRTDFKDETIFIMYHQVTELLLKMLRHELEQIVEGEQVTEALMLAKLPRMSRYTKMLINSFDIMRDGMDHGDYNEFRKALAPASGFQSAQFRYIEILCTRLENLVNDRGRKRLGKDPRVEDFFDHIYWKDAGVDRESGKKTLTMGLFEAKYLTSFIQLAKQVRGKTLEQRFLALESPSRELIESLREFDRLYNVEWPKVHLRTAEHYLSGTGGDKAATGGSPWKKYLHPKFQQRKFFPSLWSDGEKAHWGEG